MEASAAEQRRAQENELVMAPVASKEVLERVEIDQIDSGPVDYVLRCTAGLFEGRFIYVNRTPQGELFGSDKGSKDITMYIENACLSPKHAEIKFNDQTHQYFLRDVDSADGTWVRLRWNRSVEVAPGQVLSIGDTLIDVSEGVRVEAGDEVRRWLTAYRLQHLLPNFSERGLASLQDLRDLHGDMGGVGSGLGEEEVTVLASALAELDQMWPPATGYPHSGLCFSLRSPPAGAREISWAIDWEGGTLALAPIGAKPAEDEEHDELEALRSVPGRAPKDVIVGHVPVSGWDKCELLRVGYSFGRFYVHLSERSSESSQKVWVRLRSDQRHWLQPHDLFRIGDLEFQVLRFNVGVHSEQGFRASMEDEEILLQDLATSNRRHCSYFAVYDGHGGRECVKYVRERLHMNFVAQLHARNGLDMSSQVHHDIHDSLFHGFEETDRQFLSMARASEGVNGGSGCAAVVACIVGGWVWCANCGDSRALLCRDGRAIKLSLDHRPDREDEAERIENAGGFVSFRRVLGRLAVSRAFGDEEYKVIGGGSNGKPLVICDPEIRYQQLTPQDEFLFMACDGLFDVFSSQEAVSFIHARLSAMPSNEQDPQKAVQDIVHEAIHERRSRDNVTALLVTFKRAVMHHK